MPRLSEERRLVTVLFADVAGSTELGSELDPEDLRALLGRFFEIAREVVTEHGGTIEKFIGDAVMAVFGLPQAHDDDPVRSLSAALALRDKVRADPALGDRLPIRLGINTGEVVAGQGAGQGSEFLVTGDAVNVAARLQQAAEPWEIVVGERTARAAGDRFDFGPTRSIEAKGKPGGIPGRSLAGAVSRTEGDHSSRFRMPFVGREADLDQLDLLARRAFGERRPFLVSVIAPAGTGKTRLLEEFLGRVRRDVPQVRTAVAQCLPYGQRLTYWPLRALLVQLLGLDDDVEAGALRTALHSWLERAGVEEPDAVGQHVAATVGAGDAESGDRPGLLAAWRTLVEAAAGDRPLVLVIEDLHWSSDSLLDLFEFVLQPRGESPLLIVALTRPELLLRRPTWGGGRRNHLSLALDPLTDASVEELVRQALEGASAEIVAGVVARAEGNPFFAGEIVQSLMERAGSTHDAERIEEAMATLPDTVQATVLARIDLLAPEDRQVLKLGSVLGRAFRPAAIAALEPALADLAADACESLVERDLLRPSGADTYAFRHILIREVAYGMLPRAERTRLHAAAARWLEGRAVAGDHLAELVAFHYREAASLGSSVVGSAGVDVEELRARAVEWLARAAEVARAGAASTEAARHLEAAIELADEEALPELYEALGAVDLSGTSRVRAFQRARELAIRLGRPADQRLRIIARLATVYFREQGSVADRPAREEVEALLAEGTALLSGVGDDSAKARFLIAQGFIPFWLAGAREAADAIDEAERQARAGLEIAERLDDPNLVSAALDALAGCAQSRQDYPAAAVHSRRRVAMGDRLNLVELIDAHAMVAWNSVVTGDLDVAVAVAAEGMARVQPGQVPNWALHLAAWQTLALFLRGDWDRALAAMAHGRTLWIEAGRPSAGYALRGFASAAKVARARHDEATFDEYRRIVVEIASQFPSASRMQAVRALLVEHDVERMLALIDPADPEVNQRPDSWKILLATCIDLGHVPPRDMLQATAEWGSRLGLRLIEAEALRGLGIDGDREAFDRALELARACGARPTVARILVERGRLTGDGASVAEGRRILDDLGDREQLDRYDT